MIRLLISTLAICAVLAGCAGTGFTNVTWKWTGSTTTLPASQSVVPDPNNYTIEFKQNQTFEAKADCNQVSGSWSTNTGNAMDINLGPSTMAACGPDSLAPQYVAGLDKVTNYVLDSNGLTLTLGTEGTMTFRQ